MAINRSNWYLSSHHLLFRSRGWRFFRVRIMGVFVFLPVCLHVCFQIIRVEIELKLYTMQLLIFNKINNKRIKDKKILHFYFWFSYRIFCILHTNPFTEIVCRKSLENSKNSLYFLRNSSSESFYFTLRFRSKKYIKTYKNT